MGSACISKTEFTVIDCRSEDAELSNPGIQHLKLPLNFWKMRHPLQTTLSISPSEYMPIHLSPVDLIIDVIFPPNESCSIYNMTATVAQRRTRGKLVETIQSTSPKAMQYNPPARGSTLNQPLRKQRNLNENKEIRSCEPAVVTWISIRQPRFWNPTFW